MESVIKTIHTRTSCRTYSPSPVGEDMRLRLNEFFKSNTNSFFGNDVRFQLLEPVQSETGKPIRLGTYGFIRGATLFIVGWVRPGPGAAEDFGYAMEKNILKASEMGLGTCWLGGTFRRNAFSALLDLPSDGLIPAVTPIGFAAERKTVWEKSVRRGAGSDRRKPFKSIFFEGSSMKPMPENGESPYSRALECVRWAPSASNRQPWRVVSGEEGRQAHFFMNRTKGYENPWKSISMQNVDMGIAMCHFELAIRSLGKNGRWKIKADFPVRQDWEYIVSWLDETGGLNRKA